MAFHTGGAVGSRALVFVHPQDRHRNAQGHNNEAERH
jgi:hypothetical protein